MNETLQTIVNRRSIRAYKPEQIKDQELQAILEAGKFAPSGMNTQPWHFSVIQNQVLLTKINGIVKEALLKSGIPQMAERAKAENFNIFYGAPTLIIVSGDPKVATPQFDCALALGNMFLAATSLVIGSCWIHAISNIFKPETNALLLKEIGVPEGYIIYSSGAFGYQAESPAPAPRKENTVNIIK
jgi:nitroreductase